MKKRSGFTLAEVLITLGIIGVIAAMTIPTLLQNTNSAKFTAQFKKTLSTLSQAALMGQAQYDTDFSMTRVACNTSTGGNESLTGSGTYALSFCGLFNSTLAGYSYNGIGSSTSGDNTTYTVALKDKAGKVYKWSDTAAEDENDKTNTGSGVYKQSDLNNMIIYSLADGSIFGFNKAAKACSLDAGESITKSATEHTLIDKIKDCTGFIDVNGTAAPNVEVKCADGSTQWGTDTCSVAKGKALGDVFPIVFHDGTVEPATNAAKSVLLQGK